MSNKMNCPKCGHSFDVEEALSGQLEAHIKAEYEKKAAEQAELVKAELSKALELERKKIEKASTETYEEKLRLLSEENEKRKTENKTLREKEVALMRQEAELKEKQEELSLQLEKQLLEGQKEIEEKARGKERESFELEKQKLLEQIENGKKQSEQFVAEKKKLEEERNQLNELKEKQGELLKAELSKALEQERKKIEQASTETWEEKIRSLSEENEKRKTENKVLREKEVALMRQEVELKEKQEELNLSVEKQMLEKQKEIEEKARAKERESFEMEKTKLLKQIEDNKKLAEEMKRKAEQGSMQLQGEVQELALEQLLKNIYPFDKIQEVPKGVRGADSIQFVVNPLQQTCGSIVYESKRTKNFANDWIDKLKQDQVTCKADIAVLVTETMPNDMERFGEKDGVWICGFHEVRSLSFVLREMLIRTHSVKLSQENKGDKMALLYNYLTSNEFVQNIKRIVENYDGMVEQLNSEKKAMYKIWASREKQIWVVQENISALFGSIKGIAGKELETSNVLELPDKQVEE